MYILHRRTVPAQPVSGTGERGENMTLQQLKYAIEIAGCGSMNEAAKRLFMSQPSLSNAIKELENELGIVIFERSNRGISVSLEGVEFLGYARQIIEQAELIENRYHGTKLKPLQFSISAQHYAFVVEAFVQLLAQSDAAEYRFSLRETKTYEIIEDVKNLHSDIGILYMNERNAKVMNKLFSESNLKFTPLFNTNPHIFVGDRHPLANRDMVAMKELEPFPCITFEQGDNNSLHFAEEMLNVSSTVKKIEVSDRATLTNLLIGTDGYTIGTGVVVADLSGGRLTSIPVECNQIFTVGWIANKDIKLSKIANRYIELLNHVVSARCFDLEYCLL